MIKKKLEELTFKDNFMFAAVMMDSENCRLVLERILGIGIKRVEVSKEKSILYHPEYKGVRLDVYAKDERNTRFDVEMQVTASEVSRRSRYYHDQMDMEVLATGANYVDLPETYVIFLCDFDPFGLGKYRYTITTCFKEDNSYNYNDGRHTLFLSTKGNNDADEPAELVKFLKFVGASIEESEKDYQDDLVNRIQSCVENVKKDREMGERYMMFEELLKEEYESGKAEGKEEGKAEKEKEAIELMLKIKKGKSEDELIREGYSEELVKRFTEIINE